MIPITRANGRAEQLLLKKLKQRSGEVNREVTAVVNDIIENVKENGDEALREYSLKFDGNAPQVFEISGEEIQNALNESDEKFVCALRNAEKNIRDFHERQRQQSWINTLKNGSAVGQRVRGLSRVGLYVPGGTAAYPSSVLMNAVPAKIAGVKELIMVTPPQKDENSNKNILAAAAVAGVNRVFQIGGAQAVAALAFGTKSVPKVDKIVGPGNIYVATAKRLLYGIVDIDMIAGPSEILIIADESANPKFLAADLLSQAEHDVLASALLLTTSQKIAEETIAEIEKQAKLLPRNNIIEQSLKNYGAAVVFDNVEQALDFAEEIAPEHLEICLENPMEYLGRVNNAGSVFLGNYSPESLGDYYAGPNHVLPTGGTARFFSPLSVDSFVKKSGFIYYTKEALAAASEDIITLANAEGLAAHAGAVKVRAENNK